MTEEMATALHELEKDALTGDKSAVLQLVSLVREYRAALIKAEARRYSDGALDGCAVFDLVTEIEEANIRATQED